MEFKCLSRNVAVKTNSIAGLGVEFYLVLLRGLWGKLLPLGKRRTLVVYSMALPEKLRLGPAHKGTWPDSVSSADAAGKAFLMIRF